MKVTVRMTRFENIQRHGEVVTLDMEEYLKGVLPAEIYENSTPMQAKRAQAICARTYALRKAMDGSPLDDTSTTQNYRADLADSSPQCAAAVDATAGQVLTYNGEIIYCYYSASNDGETKRTDQVWTRPFPYYKGRPDEWDRAAAAILQAEGKATPKGHGVGMSQIGAAHAARLGEQYEDILAFYYPGAMVTLFYSDTQSDEKPKEAVKEECGVKDFPIIQDFHKKNDCYKKGVSMVPQGIMVHSVGCKGTSYIPRWRQWDTPGFPKCVHAFIDTQGIYQTLPFTMAGWHCAGAGNKTHISFEICEPSRDTNENAADLYAKTLYLCAYLCHEYDIAPEHVISHAEGHKMGIANNHADVGHWWGKPGTPWGPYTMDRLRADISGALGLRICFPYFAQVVTEKSPLGVWSIPGENAAGRISLGTLPKGHMVQVVGSSWLSGWYLAMLADGRVGHSNGKYLLPMEASVDEEQPENLASEDTAKAETFTVIVPDVDADAVSWLLENYSGAYTLLDGAGR